ncbi:MAG: chromate transporter, partial [Ktedonobacterales bacterium]
MSEYDPPPSTRQLFGIWAGIGLQSFGGGASTTFLIQRAFIERHRWVTMEEFTRLWSLCLLAPGINLIGITVLLGKRMGGTRGIAVSLAGLLLPSATITCLLTALFTQVERQAAVQAALRGVVPATAGIMMLVLVNFARPIVRDGRRTGPARLLLSGGLVTVFAVAIIVWNVSAIFIVIGAACLGVAFYTPGKTAVKETANASEK